VPEAIHTLGQRLHDVWARYRSCFQTQTRDGGAYAHPDLSGLLRMEGNRHYSGIGRETGVGGQNLQHFMSHSPWSAEAVYRQVQEEVKAVPELTRGAVVLVDESADEKAGDASAGAAKQYNGRLGKVETSQVGVFLSYVNLTAAAGFWTWITGKLFLTEAWFETSYKKRRKRLGIPESLRFKTKVELAWDGIEEVIAGGLSFEIVGFDSLYGRSGWLRAQVRKAQRRYMAEIPADTAVYLEKPTLGIPPRQGQRGKKPTQVQVLAGETVRVDSLRETLAWQRLRVRATERGELNDRFAARRVWTVHDGQAVEDWLVIREEAADRYRYALCNASADTSLEPLAWWKGQRYFIERANQDAKSELGWDELQAQRYRAWNHHLALTVLASWCIAQTQLDWAQAWLTDKTPLS
jgi:SRSO17 transposase